MSIVALLAATPTPSTDAPPFWMDPRFMLIAVICLGFFMMSGGKSRKTEDKKRRDMLANLKRGDRIETIGGILASVVEVREADVLLKIDESTNTKIRMTRDAIKRVLADEPETK
jgi:preprotein translocase subunit YajC